MDLIGIIQRGDTPSLVGKIFFTNEFHYMIRLSKDFNRYIIMGCGIETSSIPRTKYSDLAFGCNDFNYFLNEIEAGFTYTIPYDISKDVFTSVLYDIDEIPVLLKSEALS